MQEAFAKALLPGVLTPQPVHHPALDVVPRDADEARIWRLIIRSDTLEIENQLDDPTRRARMESAEYLVWRGRAIRARIVKRRQIIDLDIFLLEAMRRAAASVGVADPSDPRCLLASALGMFRRLADAGWEMEADETALVELITAFLATDPDAATDPPRPATLRAVS